MHIFAQKSKYINPKSCILSLKNKKFLSSSLDIRLKFTFQNIFRTPKDMIQAIREATLRTVENLRRSRQSERSQSSESVSNVENLGCSPSRKSSEVGGISFEGFINRQDV